MNLAQIPSSTPLPLGIGATQIGHPLLKPFTFACLASSFLSYNTHLVGALATIHCVITGIIGLWGLWVVRRVCSCTRLSIDDFQRLYSEPLLVFRKRLEPTSIHQRFFLGINLQHRSRRKSGGSSRKMDVVREVSLCILQFCYNIVYSTRFPNCT